MRVLFIFILQLFCVSSVVAEQALLPSDVIVDALTGERTLTRTLGAPSRGASRITYLSEGRLREIDLAGENGLSAEALSISTQLLTTLDLRAIDVPVQFKFASAEVTDEGFQQLNALGTALSSDRLSTDSFILAGHTDSIGSERSNRRLSKRRADAVREYLVQNFHIDRSRLIALGLGEALPKISSDPAAAENRRVEVQAYNPS